MSKSELLSTYTAEQLAEMVEKLDVASIGSSKYIHNLENEIKEKQDEINHTKKQFDRSQTTITQIDEILEELFGVTHETTNPGEFKEILTDKIIQNIADFLPSEPIKVADMLISATYTRKKGNMEMALHKAFGNNADTVTENVYSVSELRQIAEHLLVYCNANGEGENEINR